MEPEVRDEVGTKRWYSPSTETTRESTLYKVDVCGETASEDKKDRVINNSPPTRHSSF